LTWLYRKRDVHKLRQELDPPVPEFGEGFHGEDLERVRKLEKEIYEIKALKAVTPTEWEKQTTLQASPF
jgi:hypothetical protein